MKKQKLGVGESQYYDFANSQILCSGNNSHLFLGLFKPIQVISKNFPGTVSGLHRWVRQIFVKGRKGGREKGRKEEEKEEGRDAC